MPHKVTKENSRYYNWRLFAIHVRTNHVHLIVQGDNKRGTQMACYYEKWYDEQLPV